MDKKKMGLYAWIVMAAVIVLMLLGGNSDKEQSASNQQSSGAKGNSYSAPTNVPATSVPSAVMLKDELKIWTNPYGQATSVTSDKWVEDYVIGWKETWGEQTIKLNSSYTRLTGSITIPLYDGMMLNDYWTGGHAFSFVPKADIQKRLASVLASDVRSLTQEKNSYVLEIYGDGRLLYTSPSILYRTEPISFNVNVSGINEVRMKYRCLFVVYGEPRGATNLVLKNIYGHYD